MLKSNELVKLDARRHQHAEKYERQEKLKRVWAPQTIFDPEAEKYMVYWLCSMRMVRTFYAYANKDFTDLEGDPKALFMPENRKSCIDGDAVYKDSSSAYLKYRRPR